MRRILHQTSLDLLEKFYICGFNFIKKISKPKSTPFKVISVGNISTGGTGKSVLVKYLADRLPNVAIVSRGYKGNNEKTGNSLLVSDDCSVEDVGDEAFMLSKSNTPVVVGSNRYKSINLLKNLFKDKSIKYVVLDDAYQNFKIVKDLDIVLLNACNPFDNGHCLPAGNLREKDLTRADIIILTHSDMVDLQYLSALKASLSELQCPVLLGRHKVKNLLYADWSDKELMVADSVLGEEFLAVAGIGSFSSFIKTLNNFGLNKAGLKVVDTIEFKDHHRYSAKDISLIKKRANNKHIVTTMKDWYKIKPFITDWSLKDLSSIYIIDITFDFLVSGDEEIFWEIVNKSIK